MILEGRETFENQYAVGGPINPRTGSPFGSATKAFAQWAAQIGKPVVTDEEADVLKMMEQAVLSHPHAPAFVRDGFAEGVVGVQYCGMPCQIRMDYFHPERGLVDLKTCEDIGWFEADARRFGYIHQMAFYREILLLAAGTDAPVHIIAVEKRQPYRCGIWQVCGAALAGAKKENEAAIQRLKHCMETQFWPTCYEELRFLDL